MRSLKLPIGFNLRFVPLQDTPSRNISESSGASGIVDIRPEIVAPLTLKVGNGPSVIQCVA